MEFQSLDLTIDDILGLHRGWIAQLYVEDRKTEVEIVNLLHERGLFVTFAQIQHFIRQWDLVQLPAVEFSGPSPSPTLSDDWELVSTPPKSENVTQPSYTPSDPVQISEYNKKPLPSIPILNLLPKSSKIQKRRPSSTTDRLRLTCHHGPTTSDAHEVQTTLKSIPDGLSPIDRYAGDSQAHERIALGLESASESTLDEALGKALDEALDEAVDEALDEAVDEALDEAVDEAVDEAADEAADENIVLQPWRRAADPKTNGTYRKIRIGISLKRPKRGMSDGPNGDENNRSRKRKPHRDEDEQERKGRKKTPSSPSPPDEA